MKVKQMRNILILITDIRDIIIKHKQINPHCLKLQNVFNDVDKLYESLQYYAPEHLHSDHPFLQLQDIMNFHINQDDYINFNWCKNIIDIFLDPNYGNK